MFHAITKSGAHTIAPFALAALLVLAIALAWFGSYEASFQFDDWNVIVKDLRVQSLSAWWHSLPGIRAGLKLSYALNYEFGADPSTFREFNIAVHALNTILVFSLLRRRGSNPAALAAAAVFALAPVQTEAVTYICGRSSSLVALPCLLSLWCWEAALQRPERRAMFLHAAGVACYLIALSVKETAIVLPLALLVWRPGKHRALWAYASVAALALVAALASPTYRHLLLASLQTGSLLDNLAAQAQAWGFLLQELVRLSSLNADPQLRDVAADNAFGAAFWILVWAAVLTLAWARRKRTPELTFAVLWFGVWLLPTNSLLPRLDIANDRQLYMALIGPAWLLGQAIADLAARRPRLAWAAVALLAVTLGVATRERNLVYRSEVSFWQDALQRSPSNARAANNLGVAYAVACRDADASRAFEQSIAANPNDFRARINLRFLRDNALTRRDASGCRLIVQ